MRTNNKIYIWFCEMIAWETQRERGRRQEEISVNISGLASINLCLAYSLHSVSVNVKKGRGEINSLIEGKGSEMSSLVKLLGFCFAVIVQHFGYSSKSYFEKQSTLLWLLAASHNSP